MKQSRANISSQLKELKTMQAVRGQAINFEKIIAKQQEAIQSLKCEVLLLKSYISLQKASSPFQLNCSDISISNISTSSQSQLRGDLEDSVATISLKKHERIIKQLCQILQVADVNIIDEEAILGSLTRLKQIATKKQQPIFVERVKEIKVPITVEKEVERIVEKIVYVEKPIVVEKIVYQTVFKQKIIERFVERKKQQNQEQPATMNKSYSQRSIKYKRNEQNGYEGRYEQKNKYDQYRRPDGAGNLTKKRVDYGKQYYRKDY